MSYRKKAIAALIALICLLAFVLSTLAYFTAEQRTHNYITTGSVDIELLEYTSDEDGELVPFPVEEGINGVVAGESVTKTVEVKNTGLSPAWVRIKVDKVITLAQGVEGDPDTSLIELVGLDTKNWTLQDGWYYYNTALEPEAITPPLFTHVRFAASMDNLYQNSVAEVIVSAQAVQSANNGDSALTAASESWPAADGGE